jgi:hypothetical protein
VSKLLQSHASWSVVSRNPLAAHYDTDFVVIKSATFAVAALSRALLASPHIRDIHPDKVIRRPLAIPSDTDPPNEQDEAMHHASRFGYEADGTITKLPGRLHTAWSHETALTDTDGLREHASTLRSRFQAHTQSLGHIHTTCHTPKNVSAHSVSAGRDLGAYPARHLELWGELVREEAEAGEVSRHGRRLAGSQQVTTTLKAPFIWQQGFKGTGIRVGARFPTPARVACTRQASVVSVFCVCFVLGCAIVGLTEPHAHCPFNGAWQQWHCSWSQMRG